MHYQGARGLGRSYTAARPKSMPVNGSLIVGICCCRLHLSCCWLAKPINRSLTDFLCSLAYPVLNLWAVYIVYYSTCIWLICSVLLNNHAMKDSPHWNLVCFYIQIGSLLFFLYWQEKKRNTINEKYSHAAPCAALAPDRSIRLPVRQHPAAAVDGLVRTLNTDWITSCFSWGCSFCDCLLTAGPAARSSWLLLSLLVRELLSVVSCRCCCS